MQQLGELQRNIETIHRLNAEVIAVASRNKADVAKTRSTLSTSYVPVQLILAPESYVLVPGPIPALMKEYGVYNEGTKVAHPATLIVDRTGVIRWRYVGRDDTDRPGAATIIGELRRLP